MSRHIRKKRGEEKDLHPSLICPLFCHSPYLLDQGVHAHDTPGLGVARDDGHVQQGLHELADAVPVGLQSPAQFFVLAAKKKGRLV